MTKVIYNYQISNDVINFRFCLRKSYIDVVMCLFFEFDIDVVIEIEIEIDTFFGTRIGRIGRIYTDFLKIVILIEIEIEIDTFFGTRIGRIERIYTDFLKIIFLIEIFIDIFWNAHDSYRNERIYEDLPGFILKLLFLLVLKFLLRLILLLRLRFLLRLRLILKLLLILKSDARVRDSSGNPAVRLER